MARRPHRHRQKHAVHVTTCPARDATHVLLASTNLAPTQPRLVPVMRFANRAVKSCLEPHVQQKGDAKTAKEEPIRTARRIVIKSASRKNLAK